MTSSAAPAQREVWTIGHWTRSEGEFLHVLRAQHLDLVVDVRAQPGSRRNPQFGRDVLPQWLASAGVGYVHLAELGGRRRKADVDPSVNAGWRHPSFKNYADYTLSAEFAAGVHRLIDLASSHRVVIMCGEPMPWRCHRLLLANALAARGWTVWHLMDDGEPTRHELGKWGAVPAVDEQCSVTYPAVT